MTGTAAMAGGTPSLSAECAVAARPGYGDLHGECRQTEDVPLPHSFGVLLVQRCRCACHPRLRSSVADPSGE